MKFSILPMKIKMEILNQPELEVDDVSISLVGKNV